LPVTLEIGYGMGGSLAEMALADPQRNFVGIEVHAPGIGNLLKLVEQDNIKNLRLLDDDAVEILKNRVPDHSLERVHLYFPDPWHKKKHNKRRIVKADFVELLAKKLVKGGTFHMATDWEHYAEQMAEVMESADNFTSTSDTPFIDRPDYRPITKFEKRGLRLGHGVWDLIYTLKG
ncbi:MAG: tRNA (guanosine(46)-N7)-methyltransferase TrmB, partial [Thiotrichaceae bacterium]